MSHKYKITYEINPTFGEFTREDVIASKRGACDAFMFASILYPDDGSYSVSLMAADGRTKGDLEDAELFKIWLTLAIRLSDSKTLAPNKKDLCGFCVSEIFDKPETDVRAH